MNNIEQYIIVKRILNSVRIKGYYSGAVTNQKFAKSLHANKVNWFTSALYPAV